MRNQKKQPGILASIGLVAGCMALRHWPLGVVGKTWWALFLFAPLHGWHATFPNRYAIFLFVFLIILTVLHLYVNRLSKQVRSHMSKLIGDKLLTLIPEA